MFQRSRRGHGFVLLVAVGILAMLSLIAVIFVQWTAIDRTLGSTFVLRTRARLLAESGVEVAMSRLRELAIGGPVSEADGDSLGYREARTIPATTGAFAPGGLLETGTFRVADESAKLNLNDPNETWDDGTGGPARLDVIVATLVDLLSERGVLRNRSGASVTWEMFHGTPWGREYRPGGMFSSMEEVDRALSAAYLEVDEIAALHRYLTIHSWWDPDTLLPARPVFGAPDAGGARHGAALAELIDQPITQWLDFQTREFALEPRCPVNVNAAEPELLQALIEPLQGVFVEEGPAENQSSEHYGWWSTRWGTPDPHAGRYGVVRKTRVFSRNQAERLARAMHDRVHGVANTDLMAAEQPDADGDGVPEPNPFETWDEFKQFIDYGLAGSRAVWGAPSCDPGTAAHAVWIGDGFGIESRLGEYRPQAYATTCGVAVDPLTQVAEPSGIAGYSNPWKSSYRVKAVDLSWRDAGDMALVQWYNDYFAQFQRDMVIANFNPNSRLNDWNPNGNLYLGVDKGQLLRHTTEFCFEPTGVFSVITTGTVAGPDDDILAAAAVSCVVRPFDLLRLTTQAEFLAGLSPDDSGKSLAAYFDPQSIDMAPAGWNYAHRIPGGGRLTLQSYPEPYLNIPDGETYLRLSRYDGYLMPATRELKWVSTSSQYPIQGLSASACFNGDNPQPLALNATGLAMGWSGEPRVPTPGMTPEYHRNVANQPHWGALTGARAAETPGTVYPDGAYSEAGRVVAYRIGNFNQSEDYFSSWDYNKRGQEGALHFWMKPNFHPGLTSRIRKLLSGPSKKGLFAVQQWNVLYYFGNAASIEEDGFSSASPAINRFVLRTGGVGQGGHYGAQKRNCWMPTRCLAWGCAWQNEPVTPARIAEFFQFDLTTTTATRNFPLRVGTATNRPLEAHQWASFLLIWKMQKPGPYDPSVSDPKTASLFVNRSSLNGPKEGCNHYLTAQNMSQKFADDFNLQWLRFGELPAGVGTDYADPLASPYAADATIDECYLLRAAMSNYMAIAFLGRYIRATNSDAQGKSVLAAYTTPPLPLHREFQSPAAGYRLRSVAWTLARPLAGRSAATILNNYKVGVSVNGDDRPDPCILSWGADLTGITDVEKLSWDPVSVDFREAGGDWHFESRGEMQRRFTYPGGSVFSSDEDGGAYAPDDAFQCRVYFHYAVDLAIPNDLFEAPALDDLTVTFWRQTPAVLQWQEE